MKCFTRTDIVLVIGLRIGNNRIQLWSVTFDGITLAATATQKGAIVREQVVRYQLSLARDVLLAVHPDLSAGKR